jgi:hypothetical protein
MLAPQRRRFAYRPICGIHEINQGKECRTDGIAMEESSSSECEELRNISVGSLWDGRLLDLQCV